MRTRNTILTLFVVLAVPALALAQGAAGDGTPTRPWYYSTAGIATATTIAVSGLKRLLGNADGFNKVPTWVYACVISVSLTAIAAYGLKTLTVEVNTVDLFWQAIMSAALSSGAYEWFNNGSKTLKASARSAGVKITDQH